MHRNYPALLKKASDTLFYNFREEFDEDSGQLPSVTMKIYKGDPKDKQVIL